MPVATRYTGVVTKLTIRVTGEGLPVTPLYSAEITHSTITTATPMKKREPNLFRRRKNQNSFPSIPSGNAPAAEPVPGGSAETCVS